MGTSRSTRVPNSGASAAHALRRSCRRSRREAALEVLRNAPMLPAPMVSTTSPSRSTPRSAVGQVVDALDEHRLDERRAMRTARQMARPSAPAIGASPAA